MFCVSESGGGIDPDCCASCFEEEEIRENKKLDIGEEPS
jgi:hypothetical protein